VHAAQALLLVLRAGGAAGLVVGDHQTTLRVQLEPVDDAAQPEGPTCASSRSSSPISRMADGVFHREVGMHERPRIVEERLLLRLAEAEQRELGVDRYSAIACSNAGAAVVSCAACGLG
jgi:hypothetical protein